ncbi:MAG: methionine--tRNA ligase, partial [Abitibacteriaceae bacterium]|nr:methionine--tRNA ligase [Abditibacteriaceae bacterium]
MSDKVFFLTTPIYYINGRPHIGHAYTQIASDARARFERLRGRRVYFLTGTDENAVKVARVAREMGRDPQEYVDELAQVFKDEWQALNISYDDFVRTTEPRHKVVAQQVIEKLWQGGYLSTGTYSGWYSVPDETFFPIEETVERDGQHYIANPSEDQSKDPLEWVEETTHYFKQSEFEDWLLAYYDQHPETLRPRTRRNETLSYIRSGLRDASISREDDWGVPLPASVPASQGHVIYVWFEALMNYFSAPGYLSDDPERQAFFQEVWPPDLQLMSKDIFTRFHTSLWPSLLKALDLSLPRELFAHGFWTVDGRKMSKRDPATVVQPVPFCQRISHLSGCDFDTAVDALRYYCLREVTFGADGDFSRAGCINRYNSDLANGLGNLVNRALSMLR